MKIQAGSQQVSSHHEQLAEQSEEEGFDFQDWLDQVDIKNVDLNSIQNGILHVSVPLRAGNYLFPGKYKEAKLSVKTDSMAWLTVKLAKNHRQKTMITECLIEIFPSVIVTNPSSAYEKPGFFNSLKDLFSDVIIRGIEVSSQGDILFQGEIKKGFLSDDIKTKFKPEMFPKVDLKLESLVHQKTDGSKMPMPISIPEMLTKMGAILEEAKCSLKLHTDAPVIALKDQGIWMHTNHPELDVGLHVKAALSPSGMATVKDSDEFSSIIRHAQAEMTLKTDLQLRELASLKPQAEGVIFSDTTVMPSKVLVNLADKTQLPVSVGQAGNYIRARLQLKDNKPIQIDSKYLLDAHATESRPVVVRNLQTEFQEASMHVEGSGSKGCAQLKILHPHFSWRGLKSVLHGDLKIEVKSQNLKRGTIEYQVHPERLRPFKRQLDYQLFAKQRLALQPRSTGVSEFLDPMNQFVWASDKVLDPNTPSVGDIDSPEFRARAEQIAGVPIRKKNRVDLLIDGKTSFPKRLELIRNAKHSICLQTLMFKDDETGMQTAQALVEACKQGVEVYVIVDSLGNIESVEDLFRENRAFKLMQENGVHFKAYSNLAVRGFAKIMSVSRRHPILRGIEGLQDFVNPRQTLSTCNLLAKVAIGGLNLGIPEQDREEIREGLKLIFGNDEASQISIERLANINLEEPLELSEILDLIGQVLHLNHRWHEKYLLVDGQTAIVGGMNIADEYLKGGTGAMVTVVKQTRPAWRDTDLLLEGPVVSDADAYFARNWKTITGEALKLPEGFKTSFEDGIDVQMIQSRPGNELPHPITNLKIEALKSLKSGDKAYEASAYFIPLGALKSYAQVLKQAALRGVDVRIVTNSIESSDLPELAKAAVLCCYRDLLKAGVRIFERRGKQTMHQKAAAYGGKMGQVGSFNIDNRSASLNSEDLSVVYDQKFTQQVENMILKDMNPEVALEKRLDDEDIRSAPIFEELKSSAYAMLGDLM